MSYKSRTRLPVLCIVRVYVRGTTLVYTRKNSCCLLPPMHTYQVWHTLCTGTYSSTLYTCVHVYTCTQSRYGHGFWRHARGARDHSFSRHFTSKTQHHMHNNPGFYIGPSDLPLAGAAGVPTSPSRHNPCNLPLPSPPRPPTIARISSFFPPNLKSNIHCIGNICLLSPILKY